MLYDFWRTSLYNYDKTVCYQMTDSALLLWQIEMILITNTVLREVLNR